MYKRKACVVIETDFVQVETIPDPSLPVEAILRRCNRLQVRETGLSLMMSHVSPQVMEFYGIPEFDGVTEFLCHLAKRLGKLLKGEAIFVHMYCV